MRILAIETSCDETAVAIIKAEGGLKRPRFEILSNVVSSQIKIHAPFGGVVPALAKREHQKNLTAILITALKNAKFLNPKFQILNSKQILNPKFKTLNVILEREPELLEQFKKHILPLKIPKIDAIAVTAGPGLEPALWVGVNFARALAFLWKKPLIAVNHIEAHIIANWLKSTEIIFPALCLVVSGGHTQLTLMKNFGKYKTIGSTRDDAAGEAFDKVAKMLRIGFPGGPAIARQAEQWKSQILNPKSQINPKLKIINSKQVNKLEIKLPRPMINSGDFDFSFSGLKTAVLYLIKMLEKNGTDLKKLKPAICAEFQQAAIDVLVSKTIKAAQKHKVKTIMLGGGVAANKKLREQLENAVKEKLPGVGYHQPEIEFTGDNAAMIAAAAYVRALKKKFVKNPTRLKAQGNLKLK